MLTSSTKGEVQQSWAQMEPDKAAAEVWRRVKMNEDTLSWRHFMALRGAAAWSGIGLGDLFQQLMPWDGPRNSVWQRKGHRAFQYGGWVTKECEQWARATCETVVEKLFGLDEPKTQRVATDVEYELRRQGVWADRWNEGCMHQSQLPYRDTWDLWRHAMLLAFVSTGTVGIFTDADFVSKRVRSELRSTLNTFIDPGDMAHGVPLSYFDVTWENPEYLVEDERYHAHRDAIWKSAIVPPQHGGQYQGATFGTRMVKVCRAWRMPFGKTKGRDALFVAHGPPPHWEEWKEPTPPIDFFRVNRCLGDSFWGENFIEIMLDPLADAAEIDDIAKDTMHRTSQTYLGIDGTTKSPKHLANAKNVNLFKYDSAKGEKPPWIEKPGMLHADFFQWRDRKVAVAQQLTGVPAMHLTSESPKGTDSGRAKRLEASLLPERFAMKLRNARNFLAVDVANSQVRAARRIGAVDPDWQVNWPGVDFGAKVPVKVLDVDHSIYELRPYAVSEQKGTPAERAQYAQELFDRKQITGDQLSLILDGLYDVPKETKQVAAQRQYFAKAIDDIMSSEPDVVADQPRYLAERYMAPPIWTDPGQALAQLLPHYWQAMIDGAPQNRRALLKRLMDDVMAVQAGRDKAEALSNAKVSLTGTPDALGQVPQPGALPAAPAAPPMLPAAPADAGMGMAPQNVGGPVGLA